MRKLIFTAILFMSMGSIAFAQKADGGRQKKSSEERAQHATDMLDKKLSLNADQKAKIYALNLEGFKKAKGTNENREKRDFARMKANLDERDNKINSILNDQQRVTYKELKAKRMENIKEHSKKRRGNRTDKGEKTSEKI
ncbi:MAG: hypothetical protein V4687_17235 [Bacteroidota bacterium]